ncbi:MAG: Bax inhibitor-1/YccA family protein [Candidatus Marinimicrobia bacterium]|nr:Bax inhibitor-1/YccA family protein [Candidatus Neomarinimicrobiota bacterium]
MRTGNPALNKKTFQNLGAAGRAGTMTLDGTVNKSFLLLFLLLGSAGFVWNKFFTNPEAANLTPFIIGGLIGGLITAFITVFNKRYAKITAPIYALCEGLVLGGISAIYENAYQGIVTQAVALTVGIFLTMLFLYKSKIIKPTENFKLGVVAATGGIAIFYFLSMVLGFFGVQMPLIHSNGIFGIGFSLFVVVIAALNLVLDFDFIETGAEQGAPKYMEWYASFGLLVTLVWLYLEILRLLAKLQSRR